MNIVRNGFYEIMGQKFWVAYNPTEYKYEVECDSCNKITQLKENPYGR